VLLQGKFLMLQNGLREACDGRSERRFLVQVIRVSVSVFPFSTCREISTRLDRNGMAVLHLNSGIRRIQRQIRQAYAGFRGSEISARAFVMHE
jgi:hypothetical protein